MATWEEIKASWDQSWQALYDDAMRELAPLLQADVSSYLKRIEGAINALFYARGGLDRAQAKLGQLGDGPEDVVLRERYEILEHRYNIVAAGIYTDATRQQPQTGAVPLIAIAGLLLGVAACAWAVAAWEYFANLRDQTKLLNSDLDARVYAMKNNTTLPGSSLPQLPGTAPDKRPEDETSMLGWLLLGGLALTAAALALPALAKKG